ncbi:hypothetical protein OPV22_016466 [Ensete ventricosum]|uniref:Uncharacterized protein n=1 Tax=Ensete ventricosum TaxID=4639 RepID=A0AAV8PGU6_ENSVE|nr:hypothetical protein OPV22_016466 [Ensete ventricosum]
MRDQPKGERTPRDQTRGKGRRLKRWSRDTTMPLGPATNYYSTLKYSAMAPQSSSGRASGARQGSPTT